MGINNNHTSENFSASFLVLLQVRSHNLFLRVTECSISFLEEKIVHPQHNPKAGKVHTGCSFSIKYPVWVTNCFFSFSKNQISPSLFHNLSKLMRRDVSVMTPSYWKRMVRYRAMKRFNHKHPGADQKRKKSQFPGNPFSNSWACIPCNWQRQGKEVYSRFLKISLESVFFSFSELTPNSARSKRCPKCY